MHELRIWAYDHCLGSAVTAPLDVFATANAVWKGRHPEALKPRFRWQIQTLDGMRPRTAAGIELPVDGAIRPRNADAIMLPGIYCDGGARGVLRRLDELRPLYPLLRSAHASGAWIAANCSASFLLAESGLLAGRRATTTWWLARDFARRYPEVALDARALLTEQDRLLCSGATTAYLNLALRLVGQLAGAELASACARLLLIDANRSSQAPYMTFTLQEHASHGDAAVSKAQRFIQSHLAERLDLAQVARACAVSVRTLIRRFHEALGTTPTAYIQATRVEVARGLLETSSLAVDEVSRRVGYAEVASFRKLFAREVGMTPAAFRKAFARRDGLRRGT